RRRREHRRRDAHGRRDELLRGLHPPAGEPATRPSARDRRPVLAATAGAGRLRRLQHAHRTHQQAVAREPVARPQGLQEEEARFEDDGMGRNLTDLLVEDRDGVRILTLNRPDALNAFNTPHCDVVLIARGARLRAPFVPLGVVPEAASSLLMPAAMGGQLAAVALYTGEWISADDAVACGLALRVVEPDALLAETLDLADRI